MTPKLKKAVIAVADALAELSMEELEEMDYGLSWEVEDEIKKRYPAKYQEWIAWIEAQKKRNRSEAARRAAQTRARQRQA